MSYDYAGYRRRQYDFPQATQPFCPYQPVQPCRVTCWDPPNSQVEVLRPPQRPDPEPPYGFRNGGGANWNRQYRRYTQPTYRQPQHQMPDTYLSQPLFQRPPSCQHPLSGTINEDKDFRGEGKRVNEELCYETELIPIHHSSSLDQELDAHHKMEKKNSLNWMCSFLDEVDESKSSLLDDDYENKATFDADELIKMEHQSAKRCFGSDDEDEVDGIDVLSQHQKLVQQRTVELKSCDIRCLPTICEDSVTPKMIEDLRPRKFDHMIRYKDLKETKAFPTGKTRADSVLPRLLTGKGHRDLEVVYVGQMCLSWEILWWLDAKTRKLLDRDGEGRCTYNCTAEELQQFQVLVQRDDKFVGLVSNLDKKGTRLKEKIRSEECIVRKLRKHQERG